MNTVSYYIYQKQTLISGAKVEVKIDPLSKQCWKKPEEEKEWEEMEYSIRKMDNYCLRHMKNEIENLYEKIKINKETIYSCMAYNTHDKHSVKEELENKINMREKLIIQMSDIVNQIEKERAL